MDASIVSVSERYRTPAADLAPALQTLETVRRLQDEGAFVFIGAQNWRRKQKRLDILLDAFRRVLEVEPAARLLLVGALPDGFPGVLDSTGIKHAHVIVTGRVPHENMPGLLASANAAVISSDIETFGIPAAEALASGIAVVTTRCGGPESVIDDGVNGHVVARGDPAALAQAMVRVLRESQSGRYDPSVLSEYAWRRFSVSAFKEQWRQVHDKQ
jgi:teichuronic acid biosynthesis glycosyltransferase TuaC